MKNTAPRPIWPAFKPGMSAPELCTATGQTTSSVHRVLIRAVQDHVLRREKVGKEYRYYPYADRPPVLNPPPMQPLRKAFPGRGVIPVREGGRIVPINMNRGYV